MHFSHINICIKFYKKECKNNSKCATKWYVKPLNTKTPTQLGLESMENVFIFSHENVCIPKSIHIQVYMLQIHSTMKCIQPTFPNQQQQHQHTNQLTWKHHRMWVDFCRRNPWFILPNSVCDCLDVSGCSPTATSNNVDQSVTSKGAKLVSGHFRRLVIATKCVG